MTARAAALLLLGMLFVPTPVDARRVPGLGGRVIVALPRTQVDDLMRAHIYLPVIEPVQDTSPAQLLAHPPLPNLPRWRSDVLENLTSKKGGKVWVLEPNVSPRSLIRSLEQCLLPAAPDKGPPPWPSRVLIAAGLRPELKSTGRSVELHFERAVGPVPELLSGCAVAAAAGGPTGAYRAVGPRALEARVGSAEGPPTVTRLEIRDVGDGPADLIGGSPMTGGAGTLLAPFPDVILLMQSDETRRRDPLELAEERGGTRAFRDELQADLLVSIYWAGRGGALLGVLPPGVAPARPLPEPTGSARGLPLTLGSVAAGAEGVRIRRDATDPLVGGAIDRIAVLLRSRGFLTEAIAADSSPLDDGLAAIRWRAPTTDPALALLALAGEYPSLRTTQSGERPPTEDPDLLAPQREVRLEAATRLERRWLDERRLIPLMTAERWFTFDPRLRGVRVRADGVPLLDDAWWGNAR